ncbi:hypothetical protein LPYR103PRE_14050 [Segatella asaccharophila]
MKILNEEKYDTYENETKRDCYLYSCRSNVPTSFNSGKETNPGIKERNRKTLSYRDRRNR